MQRAAAYALAALVALCGLFLWPGRLDFSDAPRWELLSLGLPFMTAFCAPRLGVISLGLLLWAGLSLLWAPITWDALDGLWKLFLFVCALEIGRQCPETIKAITIAAVVALLYNEGIALLQLAFVEGFHPAWLLNWSAQSVLGPWLVPPFAWGAPAGLFYNKNFFGEASALGFALALCLQRPRLALSLLGGVLLSTSAAAWGAVGAAVLAWRAPRWWPVCLILVLACAALWHPSGFTPRLPLWEAALSGFVSKPWGHGIGQFYALLPAFQENTLVLRNEHAHNEALEVLFELGVPGAFAFGLIWLFAFLGRHEALPGLLALSVLALVGFPLRTPFAMLLSGLMLGWAMCHRTSLRGLQLEGAANVERSVAHA